MNICDLLKVQEYICVRPDMKGDGYLAMNVDNGDVFEINDTAEMILSLCDGNLTLQNILCRLKEEDVLCDINEEDILEFAQYVVDCGICSVVDN